MTQIAVLVGSLRAGSLNRKFAEAAAMVAPENVEFVFADIELPLYNTDVETDEFPLKAKVLKDLIAISDGVLIVTPEYNRGYPGVLKNAIDWVSRPDPSEVFNKKPTVIAGVSGGALGTSQAQAQLRNVLIYLNTKLMGQPEAYINASRYFNESGEVSEESKEHLQHFVDAVVAHVTAK